VATDFASTHHRIMLLDHLGMKLLSIVEDDGSTRGAAMSRRESDIAGDVSRPCGSRMFLTIRPF
jgi:hypothetical protein